MQCDAKYKSRYCPLDERRRWKSRIVVDFDGSVSRVRWLFDAHRDPNAETDKTLVHRRLRCESRRVVHGILGRRRKVEERLGLSLDTRCRVRRVEALGGWRRRRGVWHEGETCVLMDWRRKGRRVLGVRRHVRRRNDEIAMNRPS
jgi:hypothetical protein